MESMTKPQAEVLKLLASGTGSYAYMGPDEMEWTTGEPQAGYYAEGVNFEPLNGERLTGNWRINSIALGHLAAKGHVSGWSITAAGRERAAQIPDAPATDAPEVTP